MKTRTFMLLALIILLDQPIIYGHHTPEPTSVTIVGSFQDELGCPGDWQPECANTHLIYDASDDAWQGTFSIPGGDWEYKVALNDSWVENYGANATQDGSNISLSLPSTTEVKFYYDHKSHWITDNYNSIIATVVGSYQSAIGCPGDWDAGCLRSWLQDVDGNGIYSFSTSEIPAGMYEAKVTHNESWDENYGEGGIANGSNIPFTVDQNEVVVFEYDPITHILTITADINPELVCRGLADYDSDVDGTDASMFKSHFGRSMFKNPCPPNGPAPVPKTGQTTEYTPGDDGYFEKGVEWPNPRFTDNGDGTVTDNLTGLIWLKNANCFGQRTFDQAITDCNLLNNGQCSLTDDSSPENWRLPNRNELLSLLDMRFWEPALPNSAGTGQWTHGDPFINLITDSFYWSSTTYASLTSSAWYVHMYTGLVDSDIKIFPHYVWCVRGGH
jgi:hypothetical protein